MAALGGTGIRKLARLNFDKAEYLKTGLIHAGAKAVFSAPTFNEFVLEFPNDFSKKRQALLDSKIIAGIDLGRFYKELKGKYLFCVTETSSKDVLDRVITEVAK